MQHCSQQEKGLPLSKPESNATAKEIFWGEGISAGNSQKFAAGRLDVPSVPAWGRLSCSFLRGGLQEKDNLEMGKLRVSPLNLITILEKFLKTRTQQNSV